MDNGYATFFATDEDFELWGDSVLITYKLIATWNTEERTAWGPSECMFLSDSGGLDGLVGLWRRQLGSSCSADCSENYSAHPCANSTMIEPTTGLPSFTYTLGDPPIRFTLEEVQDQASLDSGDRTGTSYCGCRKYWISCPILTSDNEDLNVELYAPNDGSISPGWKAVQVQAWLEDWDRDTLVPVISFEIRFKLFSPDGDTVEEEEESHDADLPNFTAPVISLCSVVDIRDPNNTVVSPYNIFYGMPLSEEIATPFYEPFPDCGSYSAIDIEYQILDENGRRDQFEWIQYDRSQKKLLVEVDQPSLISSTVTMKFQATFKSISKEQIFKIVFNGDLNEQEDSGISAEEAEPEPEDLEPTIQDEDEQSAFKPPVIDLGGQKKLTDQQKIQQNKVSYNQWREALPQMNLGFKLPVMVPDFSKGAPKTSIKSISVKGESEIKFSKPVISFSNLQSMKLKTKGGRLLASESEEGLPFIEVEIESERNLEDVDMDYEIDFIDETTIRLQLFFHKAPYVSHTQPEDILKISFWGPFFSQEDNLPLEDTSMIIRKPIPPQVVIGAATEVIESVGDTMQTVSITALASNSLINILLAGSLSQVWGMINNLQMIIYAPLINVQFPGNAFLVYDVMIIIGTFDFLPTDDIYPVIFPSLAESEPYSAKFDRVGLSHAYLVMNLGSLFLFFFIHILLYIVYLPMKLCSSKHKCAARLEKKISQKIFWNSSIILVQEAYLDLIFCVVINFSNFSNGWSSSGQIFTNCITIILSFTLLALPALIIFYLWPNYDRLCTSSFLDKYGAAYEMIYHGKPKPESTKASESQADASSLQADEELEVDDHLDHWKVTWCLAFFLRRIFFALGVLFLAQYPVFQLALFIFSTLGVMIVIGMLEPLVDPFTNNLELYNNYSIIVLSYCLLLFTDFVPDPMARYQIGFAMIFLTCQNIIVNLIIISRQPIRQLYLRYKRYKLLKRHKIKVSFKELCCSTVNRKQITKSLKKVKTSMLLKESLGTIQEEESPLHDTDRGAMANIVLQKAKSSPNDTQRYSKKAHKRSLARHRFTPFEESEGAMDHSQKRDNSSTDELERPRLDDMGKYTSTYDPSDRTLQKSKTGRTNASKAIELTRREQKSMAAKNLRATQFLLKSKQHSYKLEPQDRMKDQMSKTQFTSKFKPKRNPFGLTTSQEEQNDAVEEYKRFCMGTKDEDVVLGRKNKQRAKEKQRSPVKFTHRDRRDLSSSDDSQQRHQAATERNLYKSKTRLEVELSRSKATPRETNPVQLHSKSKTTKQHKMESMLQDLLKTNDAEHILAEYEKYKAQQKMKHKQKKSTRDAKHEESLSLEKRKPTQKVSETRRNQPIDNYRLSMQRQPAERRVSQPHQDKPTRQRQSKETDIDSAIANIKKILYE